ncbi:hypothetical protein QA802_30820 [Streptomyces sp. B21-105]|uniref:hypothetical protein n=1 Tax=Streptomyces sp. B21-105 TaxID=3039417 RepID=UPI002FF2F607
MSAEEWLLALALAVVAMWVVGAIADVLMTRAWRTGLRRLTRWERLGCYLADARARLTAHRSS